VITIRLFRTVQPYTRRRYRRSAHEKNSGKTSCWTSSTVVAAGGASTGGSITLSGKWIASSSESFRVRRSLPGASAARAIAARDDEIDALYHRTFDEVVNLMRADPGNVERGTRILFAAHYLERIGDRVTNIAEDVVFLASGEIEDLNP